MLNNLNEIKSGNDEIIVINGGNSDISNNIVSTHIKEPDISPGHALNKGILIAKGKYIKIYLTMILYGKNNLIVP